MLARDLMALAIADGEITDEEREAIRHICDMEGVNEIDFFNSLQERKNYNTIELPQTRKEKEDYLKKLILLIGADEYCSPEEAYLFQIVASKMGLNQMDVVGIFLLATTHAYFKGNVGSKVLSTFLKNYIDPIGRSERQNREGVRKMYETVALHTEDSTDYATYCQHLKENIERTTHTLAENLILINGFSSIGINFLQLLKEEEGLALRRFVSQHH
jgi:hypothetical protein